MKINFNLLKLIDYEGAGNRTPVLDISSVEGLGDQDPTLTRKELENNLEFMKWLRNEGLHHKADSIMIYYRVDNLEYDFVTFIGEPNSPIENGFSEMCGNGIRSLALHIVLAEQDADKMHSYLENGISIWAGSIRKVYIESIDTENRSAQIRVNLGKIQTETNSFDSFIDTKYFNDSDLVEVSLPEMPDSLRERKFGMGFNGDKTGEPHLVLVNNVDEYLGLVETFDLPKEINERQILENLRLMASCLGKEITFNREYFPEGINFNIALVWNENIYLSTHERNMSDSANSCKDQIIRSSYCNCNTLACGTGGAITCVIANRQGYVTPTEFITVHPGGDLEYRIENNEVIMIGPAQRKDSVRNNFRKVFPSPSLSKKFLIE